LSGRSPAKPVRAYLVPAAGLALVMLAACGHRGATPPVSPPPAAVTTTGILPPGVPTEGVRPPVDSLPPAAEPQNAAPPPGPVSGRVVPVGRAPEGVVVDAKTRTVAVATRDPNQVVLINADTATIGQRIPLPGSARHLQLAAAGGPVLVPVETANALVRVDLPDGPAETPVITGSSPHDATAAANGTIFVANEHGGTLTVLRGAQILKVFTDSVQPAGMAAAGTSIAMIDVRRNTLTVYDADRLRIVGSTPAGAGPTHVVADRHGRFIVADTRGDAIRVFTALPTPREVASTAQRGAPYGIAYDAVRDRLWVTSSGTNEVVGYDMTGASPREIVRFATVQNPYTVGVDPVTGRLFVAGVTGGELEIIDAAP
jgi:DNA-binding beta-propeller fold protein YncE